MNKKFLLFGAVAVAGFITLTAFGGKTLAEQQAEITKMVTEKLDAYKVELQAACDERVASEAQTRFDKMMTEKAAEEAAKPVPGKKPVTKKPVAKGPKVDPLPQPTPGAKVPESQSKWNTNPGGTPNESKSKWNQTPPTDGKAPATQNQPAESKSKWQKSEGGGGR
jgi:hypothetical protein